MASMRKGRVPPFESTPENFAPTNAVPLTTLPSPRTPVGDLPFRDGGYLRGIREYRRVRPHPALVESDPPLRLGSRDQLPAPERPGVERRHVRYQEHPVAPHPMARERRRVDRLLEVVRAAA